MRIKQEGSVLNWLQCISLACTSLNACKNILVVVQVTDRPLCATVLRALNFEWGNPSCCVPVLRALIGDESSNSSKTIRKEVIKRMKDIEIDIDTKT